MTQGSTWPEAAAIRAVALVIANHPLRFWFSFRPHPSNWVSKDRS